MMFRDFESLSFRVFSSFSSILAAARGERDLNGQGCSEPIVPYVYFGERKKTANGQDGKRRKGFIRIIYRVQSIPPSQCQQASKNTTENIFNRTMSCYLIVQV